MESQSRPSNDNGNDNDNRRGGPVCPPFVHVVNWGVNHRLVYSGRLVGLPLRDCLKDEGNGRGVHEG